MEQDPIQPGRNLYAIIFYQNTEGYIPGDNIFVSLRTQPNTY